MCSIWDKSIQGRVRVKLEKNKMNINTHKHKYKNVGKCRKKRIKTTNRNREMYKIINLLSIKIKKIN